MSVFNQTFIFNLNFLSLISSIRGVASAKPVATAVVGPGGLAVSRPIATAIAGLDPYEVAELGIPVKKTQKVKSSAMSNYELANKLKKTYGLSNDGSNRLIGPPIDRNQFEVEAEIDDIGQGEDDGETRMKPMLPPPPSVAQVGMMLQPDLDPYSLIPQQFHNSFNIKPPHHMIISRHHPTDIMATSGEESQEEEVDQETGFSYNVPQQVRFGYQMPPMPLYYPPYNYYFYRY